MSPPRAVWYFAYGRNVNIQRFVERIGSVPLLVSRGILPGYKLVFNKVPGPKPGAGFASIEPAPGEWVEGVLYLVPEAALKRLDSFEGVERGDYTRVRVMVWAVDLGMWVEAEAYRALRTGEGLKPPREYLEEILEGAKTLGLSRKWIRRLEDMLRQAV